MSGFIGSRARRKRRNIFLSIIFLIIALIFYLIYPTLEKNNSKIIPNNNIIPDPSKELTSLASNIEELELNLFQKEQKIKFRDGQIKNLQIKLKETKSQYDSAMLKLSDVNNDLNELTSNSEKLVTSDKFKSLQDKFTKLSMENDDNISKIKSLNKKIDELKSNLQSVDNTTEDIINENQKLKNEIKSFFAKKIKLDTSIDELTKKIIEQQIEIDSYLQKIKKLEDRSHHGG